MLNISKEQILQLIEEKITQFQNVIHNTTYENSFDEHFRIVFKDTENLLNELFSNDESANFRRNVFLPYMSGTRLTEEQVLDNYLKQLQRCIDELQVYRTKIEKS